MARLVRIIVEVEVAEGGYSDRTVAAGMIADCRTARGERHILAAVEVAKEEAAGLDLADIAGTVEDLEEVRMEVEAEAECTVQGEVRIGRKVQLSTEIAGPMALVRRLRLAQDVD